MLHGITLNHGFVDGNKRTALYLTELLIRRSGYQLIGTSDTELIDIVTGVARGDMHYDDLSEWFRTHLNRLDD